MKWFKHDTDASNDPKIKKLKKKFGMAGYGMYFNLLELIARKMESNVSEFGYLPSDWDDESLELEFGVDSNTVRTMFDYMCDVGLFEKKHGRLYNSKIQSRCDDYTARLVRKDDYNAKKSKMFEQSTNSVRTKYDKVRLDKNRIDKNTKCDFLNKNGKPIKLITADEYEADGFSPADRLKIKKAMERAMGLNKTNKWASLIYGIAWDFKKAFKHYMGYEFIGNVILDEIAKTVLVWYESGETRESLREMILAFFQSEKAKVVTVTPNSVFSGHTYNSWKQGKLKIKEIQKKEWWQ